MGHHIKEENLYAGRAHDVPMYADFRPDTQVKIHDDAQSNILGDQGRNQYHNYNNSNNSQSLSAGTVEYVLVSQRLSSSQVAVNPMLYNNNNVGYEPTEFGFSQSPQQQHNLGSPFGSQNPSSHHQIYQHSHPQDPQQQQVLSQYPNPAQLPLPQQGLNVFPHVNNQLPPTSQAQQQHPTYTSSFTQVPLSSSSSSAGGMSGYPMVPPSSGGYSKPFLAQDPNFQQYSKMNFYDHQQQQQQLQQQLPPAPPPTTLSGTSAPSNNSPHPDALRQVQMPMTNGYPMMVEQHHQQEQQQQQQQPVHSQPQPQTLAQDPMMAVSNAAFSYHPQYPPLQSHHHQQQQLPAHYYPSFGSMEHQTHLLPTVDSTKTALYNLPPAHVETQENLIGGLHSHAQGLKPRQERTTSTSSIKKGSSSISSSSTTTATTTSVVSSSKGSETSSAKRKRQRKSISSTSDSSDTSFACPKCSKVFQKPFNLKSHLVSHSDTKPFQCSHCSRSFARNYDCKRHEDIHRNYKSFKCGGNANSSQLVLGNDRKWIWGCSKRFSRLDALVKHYRSDAGLLCIRPFLDRLRFYHVEENNEGKQDIQGLNESSSDQVLWKDYEDLAKCLGKERICDLFDRLDKFLESYDKEEQGEQDEQDHHEHEESCEE